MNPVREFLTGWKAISSNPVPHPAFGVGGWWSEPSRSKIDLRKVGDGLSNSAAYATVSSLAAAYAEPEIREYERQDNEWVPVDLSPAAELLNDPNPSLETELLWQYEVAAIAATGSAFYHKRRDQLGQVMELWPLYPSFIKPYTDTNGEEFVGHWIYQVPGGREIIIPPEDIVHRRWQVNRRDHRLGWSPLQEILIEIMQDQEAAQFSTSLLVNLGVPGVILSPRDPDDPGPEDPAAVAREFKQKFGGQNRGEAFVSTAALQVDVVSFNPEQMDLTSLRRVPEERITAALGWPAILVGLGAGITATSGKGEANTIREFATEQRLLPMWTAAAKQWTRQLLWDPSYGPKNPNRQLRFDTSKVRALQQDETDMVNRLDTAIKGGWATVAEGRRAINLPTVPAHDVFLRSVSQEAVGESEDATALEPPDESDF